jgi:arylsulfatase A-like enzyme
MASRQISAIIVVLVTLALVPGSYAESRPNIVLLLADDLGYTDIEPYGSEVSTPALSRLAREGVRFTNYHTAANCAPARAMLLTGVNSHLAGVPNIPEMLAITPIWQGSGIWGQTRASCRASAGSNGRWR